MRITLADFDSGGRVTCMGMLIEDCQDMVIDRGSVGRDWAPVQRWAIALDDGRLVFANDENLTASVERPSSEPARSPANLGVVSASYDAGATTRHWTKVLRGERFRRTTQGTQGYWPVTKEVRWESKRLRLRVFSIAGRIAPMPGNPSASVAAGTVVQSVCVGVDQAGRVAGANIEPGESHWHEWKAHDSRRGNPAASRLHPGRSVTFGY